MQKKKTIIGHQHKCPNLCKPRTSKKEKQIGGEGDYLGTKREELKKERDLPQMSKKGTQSMTTPGIAQSLLKGGGEEVKED